MAKLKKKQMSDEINMLMGFGGDEAIDWSKLKNDDLISWYATLMSPQKIQKIAQSILSSFVPEGGKDLFSGVLGDLVSGPEGDQVVDKVKQAALASGALDKFPLLKSFVARNMERVEAARKRRGGGK